MDILTNKAEICRCAKLFVIPTYFAMWTKIESLSKNRIMANITESTFKTLISSWYILSYLGFFCTLVIYFCRVNLSIAIVAMTESDYYESNTTDSNKSSTGKTDFYWNTHEKNQSIRKKITLCQVSSQQKFGFLIQSEINLLWCSNLPNTGTETYSYLISVFTLFIFIKLNK